MTPIQFIDLASQQKKIQKNIEQRIATVLSHGKYIMGPEVIELEEKLAAFTGAKHVITCGNGTDALLMVLMALGIKAGDAVFTTSFSFVATSEVISLVGATPVFVDIDPKTFNMAPDQLELAIRAVKANDPSIYPLPETDAAAAAGLTPRAVIPVDLFGLAADYTPINAIARANDLFVLGDGAQSFGALYNNETACTLPDASTTSFFPAKPLGCYGDGGAVFTGNDRLAKKIRSIRIHGKGKDKYDNIQTGINSRLDTIQAAVLLEKLKLFPEEVEKRNQIADRYSKTLKFYIDTPEVPPGQTSVWAQYSARSHQRDAILERLHERKIPTAVYYPLPLHCQSAHASLRYSQGDFPAAEKTSRTIFSLPVHPYLTDEQVDYILNHFARITNIIG